MQEPEKRALLTLAVKPEELRVIRNCAKARGLTMSDFIRSLLKRELVDLER
jgi:uncharacterized protein (DUF1778 family)